MACMRKLLTILNTMVKRGTLWCEGMDAAGAGAYESPGVMTIVVPMPVVCDTFS